MAVSVKPNCWNEYDELKRVIVCSPSVLKVPDLKTANDVQWEKPVNPEKTRADFMNMVEAMEKEGVEVMDYSDALQPDETAFHEQLLNRVFVRDLACVFGTTVIPGEGGTTMRRPEYLYAHRIFEDWFSSESFSIKENNNVNALEFGDCMVLSKDAVFFNTGLRTSFESVDILKTKLFESGFSEVGVIDLPRRGDTMHMDMNGNVVGPDIFLAKSYMRYFPVQVLKRNGSSYMMMHEFLNRHGYDVIWADDVKHTVADINFLNLNPDTILISTKAHKKILHHEKLKKKRLIEISVDELEKGGGGIRCMTLPVERR
ncbi:arginine deiminase family protein [Halobacillus litoralis]|uniref:arginine deiminase family protein n=1 Tax=Halobacillus litoralis TaxID=45668 RepID=UPI001CFEF1C2|nr:arginine deiminase family protein [Halobacillus litoralis]